MVSFVKVNALTYIQPFGEAVVFFNMELGIDFEYNRKQGMQLHSKMRFISSQFDRYFQDELWKKNATIANETANVLAERISEIPELKVSQKVEANGVFVYMPVKLIPMVQEKYFFHVWNENPTNLNGVECKEVRLMCSWDTNTEDIDGFITLIKGLI